ncbi:aminoacyl-tRNA deacylase [Croceicoccus bisphenolivorans]|uniref:aminoacyl-tRNA deacylase n=1 Tax=Croceicoccus bisphenolivorans TaxID=1783232 RepID=UPI00083254BA|nr:YbaK/EbsC family protein [Croceicoccus bisphenolivorans]
MAITAHLRSYLDDHDVRFEPVVHSRTFEMARAAHAAHIPGRNVAKGVMVKSGKDYVLTVVPASRRLDMDRLGKFLGGKVSLASEAEAARRFPDCEYGAIPPFGEAYGLDTVVDDDMLGSDDVYFEGGDHQTLIAIDAADWNRLLGAARHARFTAPA